MVQLLNIKQACKISNSFIHLLLTCTSTTWMESQHPLIFLDPSPAFLMRITPAKPWSKSQRYTEETPPSKYLNNTDIRCHKGWNWQVIKHSTLDFFSGTYRSLYWSKALFASTSSFLRRAEGIAPSSMGGSYLLLHGDLRNETFRF